jgi:hypothetical protein
MLVPVIASASPVEETALVDARTANLYDFAVSERTLDDIQFVRHVLPANGTTNALAQSKIIYLNRKGVTLSPGFRAGWDIGDQQLVAGFAVPTTWRGGESASGVFFYFSYELPFLK